METIEEQIKRVGADKAPRITPAHIEAQIVAETYANAADMDTDTLFYSESDAAFAMDALSCLTICVLVLANGFTVVGTSACASPENFNLEVGKRIARENAVKQIWALEGYQLRTMLAQQSVPPATEIDRVPEEQRKYASRGNPDRRINSISAETLAARGGDRRIQGERRAPF